MLRSLRADRGLRVGALRQALEYVERSLRIERLFLSKELGDSAGRVFLRQYGQLIDLSASGRLAIRQRFQDHLERIQWDDSERPVRLYPFPSAGAGTTAKPIAIDPKIAFGRPVLARSCVSTAAIVDRIDAREPVEEVAADYGVSVAEIEQAVLFERAA